MICPGAKRPPLMGSEVVKKLGLLEGVRGPRSEVATEGVLREGGVAGAIVSCSMPKSSPAIVASALASTGFPHEEQNFPVGETFAPQEEQNMSERDSTILK
jgi:hypothetical protein